MSADATVREYYESLRRGEPLPPYFADLGDEGVAPVVKFGVEERLVGFDAIAAALREQSRTTDHWTVESKALRVVERSDHAWFSDDVFLAWTDREADREHAFDTRWSGTLERRDDEWLFVGMHVSAPRALDGMADDPADGARGP